MKNLGPKEVEKLWIEYENRYCACISDDLVSNIIYGYSRFCKWLRPGVDVDELNKELRDNFLVNVEIKNQLGKLGRLLNTPLMALTNIIVITGKSLYNEDTPEQTT